MSVNIFGSRSKSKPVVDLSVNSKFITLTKSLQEKVNKTGDILSGNLDMGHYKIDNLADPISDNDACNKKYVAELISQNIDNVIKHVNSVIEKTVAELDVASKSYVADLIDEKFEERQNARRLIKQKDTLLRKRTRSD